MSVEIIPQTKRGILPAIDGIRILEETPNSLPIDFLPKKLDEIEETCRGFGSQEYLLNEIGLRMKNIKSRNSRVMEDFETEEQALGKLRAMFIALSALDSLKNKKEVTLASYPEMPVIVIRAHADWMQFGKYPTGVFLKIFLPGEEALGLREEIFEDLKNGKKVILSSAFQQTPPVV